MAKTKEQKEELKKQIDVLKEKQRIKAEKKEERMEQRLDELDEDDKEYKKIARKLNRKKNRKSGKKGKKRYDSIFMGKKYEILSEEDVSPIIDEVSKPSSFQFDQSFNYFKQSNNSMAVTQDSELQDRIYKILTEDMGVTFTKPDDSDDIKDGDPKTHFYPRRKPSKTDFNAYMEECVKQLDTRIYPYNHIFYHLSYYFSDKLVNMFKLLDGEWANAIIKELTDMSRIDKKLIVKHLYEDQKGNKVERSIDLTDFEPQ